MAKANKRFTIIGNWKMNPDTLDEARKIMASYLRRKAKFSKVNLVIAPPAPFIHPLSGKKIALAVQDVASEPRGAWTGLYSAREARSAGADYAIVGHSERRAAGDSDDIVSKKAAAALEAGLRLIVCVGEKERDEHAHYLREIRDQLYAVISNLDKKKMQWVSIAYEPVWAVGKEYDKAMKPSDIHEMTIYIKKIVSEIFGKREGLKVPVLYGGSLNADNAPEILSDAAVDGLLIGRQSLETDAMVSILKHANSLS